MMVESARQQVAMLSSKLGHGIAHNKVNKPTCMKDGMPTRQLERIT